MLNDMNRDQDLVERWVRHASRMTPSDVLIAIYVHVRELEIQMADLTQAVADLQTAVQGVSDRVGPTVDALKQAVADAQAALDAANAADTVEDAAAAQQIADLQAALDALNASATAAVTAVEGSVTALNAIAAPADPAPTA